MKPDPTEQNFTRVEPPTRAPVREPQATGAAPRPAAAESADVPESPSPEAAAAALRVAVFVSHGMGQQVPFETLDGVATALRAEQARTNGNKPGVAVRQLRDGDGRVPRAEIMLEGDGGRPHAVHLYEAYWAPLTEGRITTNETFQFLCASGFQGTLHAVRRRFWRFLFGRRQSFNVSKRSAVAFVLAVAVLGSLALMNAVILASVTSRTIAGGAARWPSGAMLADLTTDFALFVLVAIVSGAIGILLPMMLRSRRADGTWKVPSAQIVGVCWSFVVLAVGATIAAGVLVAVHLMRHSNPYAHRFWDGTIFSGWFGGLLLEPAPPWTMVGLAVVWAVVIAAGSLARRFLVQYVGDVAIYVSAHKVNRFYQTRQLIQERAKKVADFVYGLVDERTNAPFYDRVVVVGHSLGSVIAYDTLNSMLRDDADRPRPLRVRERTSMLVTFGSPLDKTAFIFRSQRDDRSEVREALAASAQPLVQDYAFRPPVWINLFTPNDLIGGSLDFYDEAPPGPDDPPGTPMPDLTNPKRVRNVPDEEATTPLGAHSEHWKGRLLARTLFAEVTRG